jgi:hypothetical protein
MTTDERSDTELHRLAVEIIATLVNIKTTAAERLLRTAGVPDDLVRRFLLERNPSTGQKRTKREAGIMVLDELAQRGEERQVIRKLVALSADWQDFHLAQNEFQARATVQKAQQIKRLLVEADAQENADKLRRKEEEERARRRENDALMHRESALLLAQFEQAALDGNPQARGYLLEDLRNRLFVLHGIPIVRSFRRNDGGEQIDAAFTFEGWHYLVECRWRSRLADSRQVDGLRGQVQRSGRQTMGLFLSIEGWSENVVPLLKQSPDKCIFLMEGYDLRCVLSQQVGLRPLLQAKLSALNLEAEPFYSAARLLR